MFCLRGTSSTIQRPVKLSKNNLPNLFHKLRPQTVCVLMVHVAFVSMFFVPPNLVLCTEFVISLDTYVRWPVVSVICVRRKVWAIPLARNINIH